jgi:FtsH-binding integral membrane protein
MSYGAETFAPQQGTLADRASADARGQFIVKTYAHLFGAILAFIVLEAVLLSLPFAQAMTETMLGGRYSWLIVLGAFMGMSWLANTWAHSSASPSMQYMGLALYVFAEAIIFVPILYLASNFGGADVIPSAAIVTLVTFTGLTAIVFITRKNFSFLGPVLGVAGLAAMGLIVCSILFGFSLGIVFTAIMIAFAAGYILYTTSNIIHSYCIGQHVAASLALFAAVALLFWYILQLFMSRD